MSAILEKPSVTQPREDAAKLDLLRDSAWNVSTTALAHLKLALGCLEVDDDDALTHHVGRAVGAMRAVAKLTNELAAARNGGDAG